MLCKLKAPRDVNAKLVDEPWYPADVREAAIDGLAELFTTTADNRLFPFTRYARGHSMEFTLRPGERLIRYFRPEEPGLFYLPYKRTEKGWEEFPQEVAQYQIRTADGPKSQKDNRGWSTGRLEYTPALSDPRAYYSRVPGEAVFQVVSPYVIIDARFSLELELGSNADTVQIETSTDDGKSWAEAGRVAGPIHKIWEAAPRVEACSAHGALTAVSGRYEYLVKIKTPSTGAPLKQLTLVTRFEMNPRTLPALAAGANELVYRAGPAQHRSPVPIEMERIEQFARVVNARYVAEQAQGFLAPQDSQPAEIVFELAAPGGGVLSGFDAGGRFLDIRRGEAPDKLTAEVRRTAYEAGVPPDKRSASIAWSLTAGGPYTELWRYDPDLKWKDGVAIDRTLRWPEVFREVRGLPGGAQRVYVRYRLHGMALDSLRLASISPEEQKSPVLEVTHLWHEGSSARSHVERIAEPWRERQYSLRTGATAHITNDAVVLYCPPVNP
jgi:hypothetical protein